MDRRNCIGMLFASALAAALVAPLARAEPAKPLESVLPEDALITILSPAPARLIQSVNRFTPGGEADIPPLEKQLPLAAFGIPQEALSAPAALVLFPGEGMKIATILNEGPRIACLVSIEDIDALTRPLGKPDADGIYQLANAGGGPTLHMIVYHGYAAISNHKAALTALAAAAGKAYAPSAQTKKIMEQAQLLVHVNCPLILKTFEAEIEQAREDIIAEIADGAAISRKPEGVDPEALELAAEKLVAAVFDFFLDRFEELKAFDAAISFDAQGLKIMTATSVSETGLIARYLVPSGGLQKLEPALPALERFFFAAWVRCDEKMWKTCAGDYEKVMAWIKDLIPMGPDQTEALTEEADNTVRVMREHLGESSGMVVNMSDGVFGLAEVVQAKKLEEGKAAIARYLASDMFRPKVSFGGEEVVLVEEVYEENVKTIAGVAVDRLKMTVRGEGPDAREMIDFMTLIAGPGGLAYLVAAVGDKVVVTLGEKDMERALGALQGRVGAELLGDDPIVKSMVSKIGLDNDAVFLLVPARLMEAPAHIIAKITGHEGDTPIPLPYTTPAAFGVKAVEGAVLRCDAYVPQACVAECMTVFMGMMMGMGGPF